jgi:hypothetical protein
MSRTPSACPRRKVVPARGVSQRLELNLPPADIEAIRTVAALTGETTLTAVVRDALKAYLWLVVEQQHHRRIISEDPERGDRIQLMPLLRVTAL